MHWGTPFQFMIKTLNPTQIEPLWLNYHMHNGEYSLNYPQLH